MQNVAENLKGNKLYTASTPLAVECHRLINETPPRFGLDHRGHLLRVSTVILTEEFKQARASHTGFVRIEDHIIQVFEKLTADELLQLSAGELADRFNCSRRHLNRLFHQNFGLSLASLRMEMRLLRAITLLRNQDVKIINVAENCGFNHLGLFNTCFKRRFGVTPGQWRNENIARDPSNSPAKKRDLCRLHATGLCPLAGESRPVYPSATSSPELPGKTKACVNDEIKRQQASALARMSATLQTSPTPSNRKSRVRHKT